MIAGPPGLREEFVQLFLTRLEDRRVLNAAFAVAGAGSHSLQLDNFTQTSAENLTVQDTGASYQFVLAEGLWSGTDGGGAAGSGTDTLTVDKSVINNTIQINDSANIDVGITFNSSDFSGLTGSLDIIGAGAVSQNLGTTLQVSALNADAVSVSLGETTNDFGSLSLTADSASIADANSVILSNVTIASSFTLDVASGNSTQASGTAIDGATSLTKLGAGTLDLTEANTYTGGTSIDAGTLLVNNISGSGIGSGSVAVNSGGSLGGDGTISGAVTVNTGGTFTPGNSPGLINTGDLVLDSGSTYVVDLNDPYQTAGTDYDQTNLTGAVTINGATLTLQGGATTPAAGTSLILIQNDGTDAVTGTFNGLAQGDTINVGSFSGRINYFGGDGNDVTIEVDGGLNYDNTGGGSVTVRENTTNSTIEIVKGGLVVESRLSAGVTGMVITGDTTATDTLTVDYTAGFFTQTVTFNGGEDPGNADNDTLIITGGTFGRVEHTFTTSDSGTILYDVDGITGTTGDQGRILYSGLEPVDMSGSTITDLVFNLPGAGDQAILEDDGTAGNGLSQIRSQNGTFETTTFANPAGSLTVNLGGDAAVFTVAALPDFTASLTIDGQAGNDTVNFTGDLSLGAGSNPGNLTVTAETISLAAGVGLDTTTGTVGNVAFNGTDSVTLNANSSVTACGSVMVSADGVGGDIAMQPTSLISTTDGNVTLQADDSVQLAQVVAGGVNTVSVTATNGAITDADTANEGAGNENIIADKVILQAATGIGASALPTFGDGEDIDIDASTLTATNTTSGAIQIFAVGDVALNQVSNPAGTVLIEAGGSITDGTPADDSTLNIVADQAGLRAAGGIGDGIAGGLTDIDTNVNLLAALTNTGDINIDETDALSIGAVGGLNGLTITNSDGTASGNDDITVLAGNTLTVNGAVIDDDGGDVVLTAEAANDLLINADVTVAAPGNITLTGQNVTLNSTGAASPTVQITGAGTITSTTPQNGPVTGTGILTVNAAATSINANSTLRTGGGVIQIATDDLVIDPTGLIAADALNGGVVMIRNASAGRSIELGGNVGGAVLNISDAELDRIAADSLRIGLLDGVNDAGDITITGTFSASTAMLSTVQLFTGGNVTQNAGAGFSAGNIGITTGTNGSVTLGDPANDAINTLAVSAGGSVLFNDANSLTIGQITDAVDNALPADGEAGVSGVTAMDATTGFVDLEAQTGSLTIQNNIQVTAAGVNAANNLAVNLLAAAPNGAININAGANITSTAGAHRYTADNMDIQGTITATGQSVNLRNATAGLAINLGSTGANAANGTLELSDAELDNITTNLLAIGAGTGNVAGNITFTDAVSPLNTSTLQLITPGTVTDTGTGAVIVSNLLIEAAAGATLDNIVANDVDTLAALITGIGAGLVFMDMDNVTVGTVNRLTVTNDANETAGLAAQNGIDTNGGNVQIVSNGGGVLVSQTINTTSAVSGQNSGSITINAQNTGGIEIDAPLVTTGITSGANGQGGDITLTTADGNITTLRGEP